MQIIAPAQVIKLGVKTPDGKDFFGLIRPRLRTDTEAFQALTDEQLENIRKGLIELSEEGYRVFPRIQGGINQAGELQIYDLDPHSVIHDQDKNYVYDVNNNKWCFFLNSIGKLYITSKKVRPGEL